MSFCEIVLPVEIVEEWEEVECELDPSLPLALVQRVRVHDARRVVQPGAAHHRSIHVPEGEEKRNHFRDSDLGVFLSWASFKNEFDNSIPLCVKRKLQMLSLRFICDKKSQTLRIRISNHSFIFLINMTLLLSLSSALISFGAAIMCPKQVDVLVSVSCPITTHHRSGNAD